MGATVEESIAEAMSREDLVVPLPPGFRFHPTDEEVIVNYLREKVLDRSFSPRAIGEVDLNKCEPWDLPSKAVMGEKEWYFYCHRDKKYPTGTRTNRATESGYWKATGKDKAIYNSAEKNKGNLIGRKKTHVFYHGRAPKGRNTNWIMHEYRLDGDSCRHLPNNDRDAWVVCRVTVKRTGTGPTKRRTIIPPLPDSSCSPKTNPTPPAHDNGNGDFVRRPENQRPRNRSNTTTTSTDTVTNYRLVINPFVDADTCAPFNTSTPSAVRTPGPVNTLYLRHNRSSSGLTGPNQPMSTLEAATTSPLSAQGGSEQHAYHSLVTTAYPATSRKDRSTGTSQQLVSGASSDDIDYLPLAMPFSPVNLDSFFD